jgi:hypothetical protein
MKPAVVYTAEDEQEYTESDVLKVINKWIDNEFVRITEAERKDITDQAYALIIKNPRWWPYITLMMKMKFKEE